MSKKKGKNKERLQMQKDTITDTELAALEAEHAAFLLRKGYAYISIVDAAKQWNTTPREIIKMVRRIK